MPSFSAPSTRRMLTIAPVASSALPNATSSPPWIFAVRASRSIPITFLPVSSSTPFSSYQEAPPWTWASPRPASPRRYSFEIGGRS
jgi:hypothetical protein